MLTTQDLSEIRLSLCYQLTSNSILDTHFDHYLSSYDQLFTVSSEGSLAAALVQFLSSADGESTEKIMQRTVIESEGSSKHCRLSKPNR